MNYTDKDVQDIVDTQVELKIKELKQALNEIKEIMQHSKGMGFQKEKHILQIIDKYLEVNNDTKN